MFILIRGGNMKKIVILLFLLSCLIPTTLIKAVSFGIGAYGGTEIPVVQDDQAQGTTFGFHARVKIIPVIVLEPNINFTNFGDPTFAEFTSDLQGSKVTSYGVDATFGAPFADAGLNLYGIFGAGFYNIKRDQTFQDETKLGWSGGLGLALAFTTQIALDARSKLNVIPSDNGGSKKSLSLIGGLNFYFGK